jgi:hypothetical protein
MPTVWGKRFFSDAKRRVRASSSAAAGTIRGGEEAGESPEGKMAANRKKLESYRSPCFKLQMRYADEHSDKTTTVSFQNDDFDLVGELFWPRGAPGLSKSECPTGPEAQMRRVYRAYCNYETGLAILSMPRDKGPRDLKEKAYIAILDLGSFLKYFGNPADLYAHLHKRAQEVVAAWKQQNCTKEAFGKRRPTNYQEEICRYTWLNNRGREETSIYYVDLNTFLFTKQSATVEKPKIRLSDVKVRKEVSAPAACARSSPPPTRRS